MKAISIVGNADASTLWRSVQPAEELARQGHLVTYINKMDDNLALAVMPFDVVVLSRLTWDMEYLDRAAPWIGMFRQLGKTVIFEVDDDIFLHLDEHLTGLEDERQRERALLGIHTLRLCDAVTVSTQYLATTVRHVAPDKPVAVVPNFIDLARFDRARRAGRRVTPALTIGWAGAKRQEHDVAPLAEAWGRIAARYPRVHFVVAGYLPPVLEGAVPASRLHLLPWLPFDRYPEHYAAIDIGCCCVADVPFNRSKSNIKAQEFGAASAAVVASPVLYRDIVRDGDTGYLATTADEWYAALDALVASPATRRALGRRLRRRVERDWALERHAGRWIGAWSRLVDECKGRRAA